jgi:hypothetical protein
VTNVGANEFGFRADSTQFADQSLAGIIAAAGNDDTGAFIGEGERGGTADAGQGASNQDDGVLHASSPSISGLCLSGLSMRTLVDKRYRLDWHFVAAVGG